MVLLGIIVIKIITAIVIIFNSKDRCLVALQRHN